MVTGFHATKKIQPSAIIVSISPTGHIRVICYATSRNATPWSTTGCVSLVGRWPTTVTQTQTVTSYTRRVTSNSNSFRKLALICFYLHKYKFVKRPTFTLTNTESNRYANCASPPRIQSQQLRTRQDGKNSEGCFNNTVMELLRRCLFKNKHHQHDPRKTQTRGILHF